MFGPNSIAFQVDSLPEAIRKEFSRYYYIYQYAALGIWLWWSYLWVPIMLIIVVLIAAALNIAISRDAQAVVYQMTQYHTTVKAKAGTGYWAERDSSTLVPGDVIQVLPDWIVPCDLAIVAGSAICDESGLTGESMPVRKTALSTEETQFEPEGKSSKHCLYAGTRVLQAGVADEVVEAVVTSSGIHTSKGQLVSQILFPAQMQFKYDEELPVVFVMLFIFGFFATGIALYFRASNGSVFTFNNSWPTLTCMVSQICHPLLPMALTVGQTMSRRRLRQMQMFCLNPKRISISGKIKVFCFDKTGTLTKQGLDFLGAQPVATDGARAQGFAGLVQGGFPESMAQLSLPLQQALASCHCVSQFGDSLVGNQVEVKMFGATGWELIEQPGQPVTVRAPDGTELQISRRFEFDHARQTMSVVTSHPGECRLFTKGSFEKIKALCTPESVPPMYDEVAKAHAMEGCYVLAVASKLLETSPEELASLERDRLEQAGSLQLQGLLLFRNELKDDTGAAIEKIKQGAIRVVMITGDNAQCGVYIARAASMLDPGLPILLGAAGKDGQVEWKLVGSSGPPGMSTAELLQDRLYETHELAITGDSALDALEATGQMERLLFSIRIFARMTPDGKVRVVQMLQAQGLAVGMCGDGGNDCGALRVAHAGVALSEAEASMVSPFSSKVKSVNAVFDLLREGRASLATSFACFKFLLMYGVLFAVLKLSCFYYGVIMPYMDYVLIDVIAVVWLSWAITIAEPKKKLLTKLPPSSLLGATNALSLVGMIVISLLTIGMSFWLMKSAEGYVQFPAEHSDQSKWYELGDNCETTVIFVVVNSLFVTSSVVFSLGGQFRRAVYKNFVLCVSWAVLMALTGYLLLSESNMFTRLFHMASESFNSAETTSPVWRKYHQVEFDQVGGEPTDDPAMNFETRLQLFLIVISACMLLLFWELVAVLGPLREKFKFSKSQKLKATLKP